MNKKGIDFLDRWAEFFFLMMLVIGIVFSVFIGSAFFSYLVVFFFGVMAGRFLRYRKTVFPFYLVVIGLLIGYLVGSRYGSWRINLFCFVLGTAISWYLHGKKILK